MANGEAQKEYYGYKPPKPYDWVTASEKALGKWEGAVAKREKEREDNEKTRREANKVLTRLEKGQNKEMNQVVMEAGFTSKEYQYDLTQQLYNNEISSKEYRLKTNNLTDGWTAFGDITKQFNDRLQVFADREAKEGSIVEAANAVEFAEMGDLKHKKITIGPNGTLYWAKLDDQGNLTSETTSMTHLNNLPGQLHNRVNVSETVFTYTDMMGDFKMAVRGSLEKVQGFENIYSTEGIAAMEIFEGLEGYSEYENIVKLVQDQMLTGPGSQNNAASILGDNTLGIGGQPYFTYRESDLNSAEDGFKAGSEHEGKDFSLGIKLIKGEDGQPTAELTDPQMQRAKLTIENAFRSQIGIKELPLPYSDSKASRISYKQRTQRAGNIETYVQSVKIATLQGVGYLEGFKPAANRQFQNVRMSGENIIYDEYHHNTNKLMRNKVIPLEGLEEDKKDMAVFGAISGLSGKPLIEAYKEAKDKITGTKKTKVEGWHETPGEFGVIEYLDLDQSRGEILVLKEGKPHEDSYGNVKTTVSTGKQNPSVILAEFSGAQKWDDDWSKDLGDFLKKMVRTGGGRKFTTTKVTPAINKTDESKIVVDGTVYKYVLTGNEGTDRDALEELLKEIITDDYNQRKL